MSKITLSRWLIAVTLLLPCAAGAAGMGRLTVLSALGQPFNAEVELVSVQKEDLSSLTVRLASPEAYRQANLQYGPALIGLRIAIETRPNGQPFVRVTSSRTVNEPFLDLLLELSWASGRLVREFTALLDPPGVAPPPPPTAAVTPAPAARAPAVRPIERMPSERPATAAAPGQYGPIERGETLSKIAQSVKPEGVSLEQMLVGLYRSNPDAFIKKNMNLVRTGKILRVPEANEIVALSQGEAAREYRAHVADWRSYRTQVADVPAAAREGGAASGRITTQIEDKAAAEPKEVVRLSKGEAPTPGAAGTGAKGNTADRIRMLEEEVTAREKALKEANERVAQLEKTIKDMQRLAEIKSQGMAAAQQQAQAQAGTKPEAPKPEPAAPAAATPPKPKPEPTATSPEPAPKPEAAKAADAGAKEAAKPSPPPPAEKAKPKPAVKAQPAKETSALDTLLDPMYLGGAALLLAGLGYAVMRRRREAPAVAGMPAKEAPILAKPEASVPPAVAVVPPPAAPDTEIDPLDEANIHIAGGRDAQAQAILDDAIAEDPGREALHVKLLEIDALRKDKAVFARHAAAFHTRTRGMGENWQKVAAMGAALDPENPLFGGAPTAPAAPTVKPEADLDFNLDAPASADATPAPAATDFEIEVPPVESPGARADKPAIDFAADLPKLEVPPAAAPAPRAAPAPDPAAPLDFKLDLGALDLSLDGKKPAAAAPVGGHDPHWHDVEAKFDLAKAYQEMGEKVRAADALKEAMQEGDSDQRERAKRLLDSLG